MPAQPEPSQLVVVPDPRIDAEAVWAIVDRVAYNRWSDGSADVPPVIETGFGSAAAAATRAEQLEGPPR
jgi:hypothetical protein